MRARQRSGLTLIEIMVTLAVIAVLTTLTVPNLVTWSTDQRVKGAARSVADAFQLARAEAIRTGNRHLVVWSVASFGDPLGAPVVVVDDGPAATANCTIDAGEIRHQVESVPDVSFGTTAQNADGAAAPDDPGQQVTNIPSGTGPPTGTSFTDAELDDPAGWLLFEPDGLPRLFTRSGASTCANVGRAAEGGGAVYVSNGRRDYSIVVSPLGTTRVHGWNGASWTP